MKNLLDDISMDALQGMRESGMSNRDIANSLGVSYATIYKYLGAQPAPHGGKVQSYCPPSCPQPIQSDAGKDDEPEEASLVVEDRTIALTGLFAGYKVMMKNKTVTVFFEDDEDVMVIPFDKVECFAKEISAISRHIKDMRVGNEVW